MREEGALIATLGTEPQVLTLCLSELLRRGEPIKRAIALHSKSQDPAIRDAVHILTEHWTELPFAHRVKLELDTVPIEDLDSESSLRIAYQHIRDWVRRSKEEGLRVHLNISGGRKPLALCAMVVAQFMFGPQDRLWYLISSPELVQSRRLLAEPGDRCQLIELPVPLWTEAAPLIAALARYNDPWALAAVQRQLLHREERMRWTYFLERMLTRAEREVVEELVLRGGTDAEIARRLGKSHRTVGHQLRSVFRRLREFLGWPEELRIDRTTLASLLAPHIRQNDLTHIGKTAEAEAPSKR